MIYIKVGASRNLASLYVKICIKIYIEETYGIRIFFSLLSLVYLFPFQAKLALLSYFLCHNQYGGICIDGLHK